VIRRWFNLVIVVVAVVVLLGRVAGWVPVVHLHGYAAGFLDGAAWTLIAAVAVDIAVTVRRRAATIK
jgi:hypothetical protein